MKLCVVQARESIISRSRFANLANSFAVVLYLCSFDLLDLNLSIFNLLTKSVLMYINMSKLCNKLWSVLYHQVYCLQVVAVQDKVLVECKIKLCKEFFLS